MKKLIYSTMIAVMLLMAACAMPLEIEQQPTTFRVPIEKDKEVWGRALSYVVKNSDLAIKVQNENLIETEKTEGSELFFYTAYRIIRIVYDNEVEYTVIVEGANLRKAKYCAYYMRTGKMVD